MDFCDIAVVALVLLINKELQAIPQLNSSIGSELSGNYCPGNITLMCNALNFGSSGIIDWYINNNLVARYNYRLEHQFPFIVTTESSILNATVQISSLSLSNNRFNFQNFTLSVNLNTLLDFQGQSITCGTLIQKSNSFSIKQFDIQAGLLEVSYLTMYQGAEGALTEIHIQWRDVVSDNVDYICWANSDTFKSRKRWSNCRITTLYTVQLKDSNGVETTENITTEKCEEKMCSVLFTSNLNKSSESYNICISANSQHMNHQYTFLSMQTFDSRSHLIQNDGCGGSVNITCPSSAIEKCFLNLVNMDISFTIMPGETFVLNSEKSPEEVEVQTNLTSISIIQKLNINNLCTESPTFIHIIWTLILVIILGISGVTIFAVIKLKCKNAKCIEKSKTTHTNSINERNKATIIMKKNQSYERNPGNKVKDEDSIVMKQNELYELKAGTTQMEEHIVMKRNRLYELNKGKTRTSHYHDMNSMNLKQK